MPSTHFHRDCVYVLMCLRSPVWPLFVAFVKFCAFLNDRTGLYAAVLNGMPSIAFLLNKRGRSAALVQQHFEDSVVRETTNSSYLYAPACSFKLPQSFECWSPTVFI